MEFRDGYVCANDRPGLGVDIDEKEAEKAAKRMQQGKFDLEDFLSTMKQVKKLGPLENLIKMLPGAKKMGLTDNAFFMHCLPVRRNMIVTDEVIDSDRSIVIPEAANREISAQVVIKRLLESL